MLSAEISHRVGTLSLEVAIEAQPGELVALLGPNGAGKSTVLRCLSGLSAVDGGRIRIDSLVVDDPSAGVFVAPEARPVGVVFQDYLLFEHLTVLENVAFGLRARGADRGAARRSAAEWLERFGLSAYGSQRPGVLSGGQAQRVALARALATNPRLLLLDEPLAALDAGTRAEVRRDLRQHLASFEGMRVLVTHDPVDAYALADRIIILTEGQVVQTGTIAEVTRHPRSRYVADLIGVNLVEGHVTSGVLVTATGAHVVIADAPDGDSFAVIRPQAISLHLGPEAAGSPRNVWPGIVSGIDRLGDRARVSLSGPVPLTAEITLAALESLALRPGDDVWATAKATDIAAYPS